MSLALLMSIAPSLKRMEVAADRLLSGRIWRGRSYGNGSSESQKCSENEQLIDFKNLFMNFTLIYCRNDEQKNGARCIIITDLRALSPEN
jgi:hypothetical protein